MDVHLSGIFALLFVAIVWVIEVDAEKHDFDWCFSILDLHRDVFQVTAIHFTTPIRDNDDAAIVLQGFAGFVLGCVIH